MTQERRRRETEEEFLVEDDIEKKKFPIWIIPVVVGPIVLIVLIVALAGTAPPPDEIKVFNQRKLEAEGDRFYSDAYKIYLEAQDLPDQAQKDKALDKAAELCDRAIDRFEEIRMYYEEHDLQPRTGRWVWEKKYEEANQLRVDITRSRGMTPRD